MRMPRVYPYGAGTEEANMAKNYITREQDDKKAEEYVREMLNEAYPEVKIGCLTFSPADIVEEMDPIAFSCIVADESGDEYVCENCESVYDEASDAEECCCSDDTEEVAL